MINAGSYNYLIADFDARFNSKRVNFGVAHSYQIPINTNVEQQSEKFVIYTADKSSANWYDSTYVDGEWRYSPIISKKDTVEVNLVKESITYDGKHFLNISTHVTKLFVDYNINKFLSLHGDWRIFWGLTGRAYYYQKDANAGFKLFDIYNNYWHSAVKKVDLSMLMKFKNNLNISLTAYNVFGMDVTNATQNDFLQASTINTLRWQEMAQPDQKALYSVDQRSYSITITKKF